MSKQPDWKLGHLNAPWFFEASFERYEAKELSLSGIKLEGLYCAFLRLVRLSLPSILAWSFGLEVLQLFVWWVLYASFAGLNFVRSGNHWEYGGGKATTEAGCVFNSLMEMVGGTCKDHQLLWLSTLLLFWDHMVFSWDSVCSTSFGSFCSLFRDCFWVD